MMDDGIIVYGDFTYKSVRGPLNPSCPKQLQAMKEKCLEDAMNKEMFCAAEIQHIDKQILALHAKKQMKKKELIQLTEARKYAEACADGRVREAGI